MPTFRESIEAFGNTLAEIGHGLQVFHERSAATGDALVEHMTDTRNEIESGLQAVSEASVATRGVLAQHMKAPRNEIESGLRPLSDLVVTVTTETNEVVESIRTQVRESKEGVRDQIRVLQSEFRQLVPSTQHPTVRTQLPAVPPATVEVAVPVPETRTIQDSPAPVDISALVPYFQR